MGAFIRSYPNRTVVRSSQWKLFFLFIITVAALQFISPDNNRGRIIAASTLEAFPITSAPGNQLEPALAYNARTDEFLVVWRDASAGQNSGDIDGQLVGADGGLVGAVLPVAAEPALQRAPAVSERPNSADFLVTWIDLRNNATSDSDIYAQLVRDGALLGANRPLNTAPGRVGGVTAIPCPASDSYLVAWHEDEDAMVPWRFFVFGRQIAANGDSLTAIGPITADYPGPGFQQVDPALALDDSGKRMLAVFRDARDYYAGSGTNDDIYGQFVGCIGKPLLTEDLPISTQFSPAPGGNRQNGPAVAYDGQRKRFLAAWTDERNDDNASDADTLDIYGQIMAADGDPLCTTPATNFEITTAPGNQNHVDIAYSPKAGAFLVVWTDYGQGNGDIYARLVDSCGKLLGEEIVISEAEGDQSTPAVRYHPPSGRFLIVWRDARNSTISAADIYGAFYEPPNDLPYQIYLPVISSPALSPPAVEEEAAQDWLDGQTVAFAQVEDIPGYGRDGCSGRVARYKDQVACYPAMPGKAIVSFDFCNYGTPHQQLFMGRFGRAFLYDQAVDAVALLMSGRHEDARLLLDYVSSYQNIGVAGAADGSFGFGFNTVGCPAYAPENRDSFYDLNYIRNGANSWLGYAFTMYQRMTGDDRYQQVAEWLADYLLTEQIAAGQPGAGLISGGYGRYDAASNFISEDIEWVSTEHNIDAFFFMRDLGALTGKSRYSQAADRIRVAMLENLWNEQLGRFDQGLGDDADALDVTSWGAIFLIAACEEEKAYRSLDYAERTYRSSAGNVTGYKPYAGLVEGTNWDEVDLVWSEGSLGAAMAYLKLGGGVSLSRAYSILGEMAKLQDPAGGLTYAWYGGGSAQPDFPEVPSAAGTGWYVMAARAMADSRMLDAFWGKAP